MILEKKNKFIQPDKKSMKVLEDLYKIKQYQKLEKETQKLIKKFPKTAILFNILGLAHQKQGNLNEAASSFKNAILLNSNFAFAYNNLGNVFKDLGKTEEALLKYKESIKINNNSADTYYNLGALYKKTHKYDESIESLEKAIKIKPDFIEAYIDLGTTLTMIGDIKGAIFNYQKAIELKPNLNFAYSNIFFTLCYLENNNSEFYFSLINKFRSSLVSIKKDLLIKFRFETKPKKLKIGFISGDFKEHPVGYLLKDTLKYLKEKNLKLFAYSNTLKKDNYSLKLKSHFNSWNEIYNKTDKELVNQIRNDGIHILIDLSGHSAKNRLPIFINKVAPIQITWGGYPGSTGISEIDYIIGDGYVTPFKDKKYFTEKIFHLPNIWISFTAPDFDIKIKELPANKNKYITFGSFNNLAKINEDVICLWSKIIKAVPKSKIFFKSAPLDNLNMRKKLIDNFKKYNIDSNSIILEGKSARYQSLESYNKVDIALDPFPYSGAITTFEAMWMGVPVLTKKGSKFVSRQTESINNNSNMSDWVAENEEDYYKKAIKFASDIKYLSKVKANLRNKVLSSPSFNSSLFAKQFDEMLWKLWNDFKSKKKIKI